MLQAIITVRTPPGQAIKTEKKIRLFLLGIPSAKKKITKKISAKDDEIKWTVQAPIRRLKKIQRNVLIYDQLVKGVLENKLAKRIIKKHLSVEDRFKLSYMLLKLTDVDYQLVKEDDN